MSKEMKNIRDLKEMISLVGRLDVLLRKAFKENKKESQDKKAA